MERSFLRIPALFLTLVLWCTSSAADPLRDSIEEIISQRHPTDTRETWQALGPQAPDAMISMIESGAKAYRRIRLIEALGHFQGSRVSEFLKKEAKTKDSDIYRSSSLKALLKSEGESAIEFAKDFLDDEDPQVRISVAEGLKSIGTARSQQVLQDYLTDEPLEWVKKKVQGLKSSVPAIKVLPKTGTTEGKKELELLGTWDGFGVFWNSKKKRLETRKVWVEFSWGLNDHLVVRSRNEEAKAWREVRVEKEKWKWTLEKKLLRIHADTPDFWNGMLMPAAE